MVTIEQVELLESKVSKAIDYVKRLTADNERHRDTSSRLASENDMLRGKLDSYQKRIAELEVILQGFKKDQERIEQGIISALDRLNHFEDAVGAMPGDTAAEAGAAGSGTPGGSGVSASGGDGLVHSAIAVDQPASPGAVSPTPGVVQPESEVAEAPPEPAFSPPSAFLAEEEDRVVEEYDEANEVDKTSEAGKTAGPFEADLADEDAGLSEWETADMAEDDEDEFLDVLKSERHSGAEQSAAAFQEEGPPERALEKSANGLELDIF